MTAPIIAPMDRVDDGGPIQVEPSIVFCRDRVHAGHVGQTEHVTRLAEAVRARLVPPGVDSRLAGLDVRKPWS